MKWNLKVEILFEYLVSVIKSGCVSKEWLDTALKSC